MKKSPKAKELGISQKKYEEVYLQLCQLKKEIEPTNSMGGQTIIIVTRGKRKVCFGWDTSREYSGKCQWRAQHGYSELTIRYSQLLRLRWIGGLPTILGSFARGNKKIVTCQVVARTGIRYPKISIKKMYLTSNYHGKSYEDCVKWRKKEAIRLLRKRKFKKPNEDKFVGFEDSLMCGNCAIGTRAFARRHRLNIRMGYSLKYLLSLEPENIFLRKLI